MEFSQNSIEQSVNNNHNKKPKNKRLIIIICLILLVIAIFVIYIVYSKYSKHYSSNVNAQIAPLNNINSTDLGPCHGTCYVSINNTSLVVGPDRQSYGYIIVDTEGETHDYYSVKGIYHYVINGKDEKQYSGDLSDLVFSNNGNYAYIVSENSSESNEENFVVFNGVAEKKYADRISSLVFSDDGKNLISLHNNKIFLNDMEIYNAHDNKGQLYLDPTGRKIAYIYGDDKIEGIKTISLDGQIINKFDFNKEIKSIIDKPIFSSDGKQIAVVVETEKGLAVTINDQIGTEYEYKSIKGLSFNSETNQFMYTTFDEGTRQIQIRANDQIIASVELENNFRNTQVVFSNHKSAFLLEYDHFVSNIQNYILVYDLRNKESKKIENSFVNNYSNTISNMTFDSSENKLIYNAVTDPVSTSYPNKDIWVRVENAN